MVLFFLFTFLKSYLIISLRYFTFVKPKVYGNSNLQHNSFRAVIAKVIEGSRYITDKIFNLKTINKTYNNMT